MIFDHFKLPQKLKGAPRVSWKATILWLIIGGIFSTFSFEAQAQVRRCGMRNFNGTQVQECSPSQTGVPSLAIAAAPKSLTFTRSQTVQFRQQSFRAPGLDQTRRNIDRPLRTEANAIRNGSRQKRSLRAI
jgi:hypothetical protein